VNVSLIVLLLVVFLAACGTSDHSGCAGIKEDGTLESIGPSETPTHGVDKDGNMVICQVSDQR
jgi:hypothetical protein